MHTKAKSSPPKSHVLTGAYDIFEVCPILIHLAAHHRSPQYKSRKMGSYVSVLNDTNDTIFVKFTANNTAIASAGVIVATLGTIATGGAGAPFFLAGGAAMGAGGIINYGVTLSQQLKADGYQELAPGEKHTSSKWSLSLLMSANIVKKKENGMFNSLSDLMCTGR